jgi:uncharacterized protein YqgC (DUF456 family)
MPSVLLWVLAVILILVGLVGVVMPMLPGTVLVFAGLLLAAWADGFTRVSVFTIVAIGLLGLASYGIDFVAAGLGVKRAGASRQAVIGATLGMMLGVFLGLPGVIIGPFAGAVIGELMANRGSADLQVGPTAGGSADLKVGPTSQVGPTSRGLPAEVGLTSQGFRRADLARAGRVGFAAWVGFVIGMALKVAIVFIMLGMFLVALLVP